MSPQFYAIALYRDQPRCAASGGLTESLRRHYKDDSVHLWVSSLIAGRRRVPILRIGKELSMLNWRLAVYAAIALFCLNIRAFAGPVSYRVVDLGPGAANDVAD